MICNGSKIRRSARIQRLETATSMRLTLGSGSSSERQL
eukprot:SAG31_NODE_967_length_10684_cov_58.582239_2_plen_38_part_00